MADDGEEEADGGVGGELGAERESHGLGAAAGREELRGEDVGDGTQGQVEAGPVEADGQECGQAGKRGGAGGRLGGGAEAAEHPSEEGEAGAHGGNEGLEERAPTEPVHEPHR